eukprot:jgi/Tetstr1/447974/TSEL_035278.t1
MRADSATLRLAFNVNPTTTFPVTGVEEAVAEALAKADWDDAERARQRCAAEAARRQQARQRHLTGATARAASARSPGPVRHWHVAGKQRRCNGARPGQRAATSAWTEQRGGNGAHAAGATARGNLAQTGQPRGRGSGAATAGGGRRARGGIGAWLGQRRRNGARQGQRRGNGSQ